MRGLNDKIALIAGAAPGNIGAATAHRLSQEGSTVVVADLNLAAAQAVAEDITAAGGTARAHWVDISSEDAFASLIDFTVAEFGGVDSLFNVAADLSANNLGRDTDVLTVPIDVWQHTIDVSLTGYFFGIRHVLPHLIERGGGSIVNTLSAAVWMAEPVRVSYSTTKAALAALTRHVATIAGKDGVRCNAVAPGTVLTAANLANLSDEGRAEQLKTVRSPRLGEPEDIAAMVAFLHSDDAAWINAQTIIVDGGAILR